MLVQIINDENCVIDQDSSVAVWQTKQKTKPTIQDQV